ncbi:hypothetical protein [Polaromonas sp. CG9_12]|nr:hypothetical protein [Polaromonas sp. CG9_12]
MVLVGGRRSAAEPAGKNMPRNFNLLQFDATHPGAAKVLQDHRKTPIQKAIHLLLNIAVNELPSRVVDSYLVTTNFADPQRNQFIKDCLNRF